MNGKISELVEQIKNRNEIEASTYMVINYKPCDECKKNYRKETEKRTKKAVGEGNKLHEIR